MRTLKEHIKERVKDGILIIALASSFYGGYYALTKNYQIVPKEAYIPMYPHARNKAIVETGLGESLVDDDGDGLPDSRRIVLAGNHGLHRWNFPVTEEDIRTFRESTLKLEQHPWLEQTFGLIPK